MTQDIWAGLQPGLRAELGEQTYNNLLGGSSVIVAGDDWRLVVRSDHAEAWLKHRFQGLLEERIAEATGSPRIGLSIVHPNGTRPLEEPEPPQSPLRQAPLRQAQGAGADGFPSTSSGGERPVLSLMAAQADYYAAYFVAGGSGYSMLAHYAAMFWSAYLGEAFILWKRLDVDDKRPLRNASNYWSPARRYRYSRLANLLNKSHPRSVSGGIVECWQSVRLRQDEEPLVCCQNPDYRPCKYRSHTDGALRCLHWQEGLLEVLHREQLVTVREEGADHPRSHLLKIQVWRMLPLLTPKQVSTLHSQLQADHARWLQQYGDLFDLSVAQWEMIDTLSLVPLMPGHSDRPELVEIEDNFNPRRKFEEL